MITTYRLLTRKQYWFLHYTLPLQTYRDLMSLPFPWWPWIVINVGYPFLVVFGAMLQGIYMLYHYRPSDSDSAAWIPDSQYNELYLAHDTFSN